MDAGSEQEDAPGGFGASGPDWAAVRSAYEAGEETVDEIRRRFGLSEWQIRMAPHRLGWVQRRPLGGDVPLAALTSAPGVRGMTIRLYRLADRRLRRLERRVRENDEFSEQEARAMAELARALERMMKLEDRQSKVARTGRATDSKDASDAAWMRAELKRRLARLGQEPGAPKNSGGGVRGDAD